MAAVPARRTSPASSVWARPRNWPAPGSRLAQRIPTAPHGLAALRDRLEREILSAVREAGVNGSGAPRVANTSNLYFDHVEAEALVIALDLKGLAVSGGSACQSGATEPSHVLHGHGRSAKLAPAPACASRSAA